MNESTPVQARVEALCAAFPGVAGVAAHHLSTGEAVRVNDAVSFPTASMIKICILFELVRRCAKGEAQLSERMTLREADRTRGSGLLVDFDEGASLTLKDLAVLMMAISDNTATNMLIDRLGIHAINQACREAGMRETELRNRIDFDKIRESNDNLAVTTPADFCGFLGALYRGELMPAVMVEQMLSIMRIQKYMGVRLRRHLPYNPYAEEFGEQQDLWVASKTGTLKGAACEGGLIGGPRGAWAIVVMTKECTAPSTGSMSASDGFIAEVSRAVWEGWGRHL
ncbi:MAG: serine hydrolase [Actinomycetota bacterium]